VRGKPPKRHGDPYVLLNGRFFLEPGVFSQANLALNARLVTLVGERVPADKRILELHAGAGNLTLGLKGRVVATEWDEQAVMCLRRNLETHGRRDVTVAQLGDLDAWRAHGADAEVLVLDPPRVGAKQTMAAVAAAPGRLERIVYVSCDPASLARDVKTLATAFRLVETVPLDMFPGTPHVESLSVLQAR
jgi:23S rRNA (uracil1939-C5)-methyltransferase